jgi:hypothetical protein
MKIKIFNALLFFVFTISLYCQTSLSVTINMKEAHKGRLLLLLSKNLNGGEPRFLITDDYKSEIAVGVDLLSDQASKSYTFPVAGQNIYPIQKWEDIAPGKYLIQGFLNKYEEFILGSGHKVMLPPDMGEGQQWNRKPINIYSKPILIEIKPNVKNEFSIVLDQIIEPIQDPSNTPFIRHIEIKSERLTKFWGKDTYLKAHVLIPHNFDIEQNKKYPLMIYHGHFPADFHGFRTEPVPADMDTSDYSDRFKIYGYKKKQEDEAYNFYKQWTSKDFPRFLAVEIQHPTPYYDDSYAVNSACQGPYGDAITYELIPYIEKEFRGLGAKGRFLYGGSTGGWEALAAQVFYPDEYNGCFAACPDPIDFRAYCAVNLYEAENAYYTQGNNTKIPIPAKRDYLGHISSTMELTNRYEAVLGSKSRSGQQFDIWEATFSPMGKDGYPQRIFDKETGFINKEVANYWRENYDLVHIMKRDWDKIGKKLEGKIHLYCGDMDNFYLNNAVYLAEDFLKNTKNPFYGGEVKYGDRAEHCWNGSPTLPNHISRLRYHTLYLDKIKNRLLKSGIGF